MVKLKNAVATLTFGQGNAKLHKSIRHISLPAGHTCPGASQCFARTVEGPDGWKVQDGPNTVFRCFSASDEARYPQVRRIRRRNLDLLKAAPGVRGKVALIESSLPSAAMGPFGGLEVGGKSWAAVVRLHVGGDFFSQDYFDAWVEVARRNPRTLFYGYTKSLVFWVRRLGSIPTNLVLTASVGGKHDALIVRHGLRSARVVLTVAEAEACGLEIDHDDGHAMRNGGDFALLVHGVQPKGSKEGKAVYARLADPEDKYGKSREVLRQGGADPSGKRRPLPVLASL